MGFRRGLLLNMPASHMFLLRSWPRMLASSLATGGCSRSRCRFEKNGKLLSDELKMAHIRHFSKRNDEKVRGVEDSFGRSLLFFLS